MDEKLIAFIVTQYLTVVLLVSLWRLDLYPHRQWRRFYLSFLFPIAFAEWVIRRAINALAYRKEGK